MIYLDNAATTKPYKECIKEMLETLESEFYNPSSLYKPAILLKKRIELARTQIAEILNVDAQAVCFTSGATESNNLAIYSGRRNKKGNLITTEGEHASVFMPVSDLKNKGNDVRFAPLNSDGTVNEDKLLSLIDENTAFVSVIHRSNETGIINDIAGLSRKVKSINKNIVFHSDGVQFFGKYDYPMPTDIDLYSISAHKVGGAKGAGALYVKKGINLHPLILGGGQERDLRSGTENTPAIIGFAAASKIYREQFKRFDSKELFDYICIRLKSDLSDININTANNSSNIISISINGINAEILQRMLSDEDILIGLGSACASKLKYNRVLSAMGLNSNQIAGSIRLSFSPENTIDEIKYACDKIIKNTAKLRGHNVR